MNNELRTTFNKAAAKRLNVWQQNRMSVRYETDTECLSDPYKKRERTTNDSMSVKREKEREPEGLDT
jgi:hypothetical protein